MLKWLLANMPLASYDFTCESWDKSNTYEITAYGVPELHAAMLWNFH